MNRAYPIYITALILFGLNGVVAYYIHLSSSQIVFLRTLIGSIVLLAIFFLLRKKFTCQNHKRDALFIAASGVAMGASWVFLYEAYQLVGVSISSLAYYCGPILIMAVSPFLFREKLTWVTTASFAVVLFGTFLVNGDAANTGTNVWGLFCGAMSAVLHALMVIFTKKAEHIDGLENTVIQVCFSFITAAVYLACTGGLVFAVQAGDWIPILILGVFNTGICCYLYFSTIGRLPIQSVSILGYLEPLSAVVFSVLLLGEGMLPLQVLGAVLILGGAAAGELAGIRKAAAGKNSGDPRL
ncbi:MAG: DMT family transporter [Methanocorpusculum sp.]|nr:DMT family transporter [Methanocorpusculum sp.]